MKEKLQGKSPSAIGGSVQRLVRGPDARVYHKAAKLNSHSQVSALCYPTPRAIPKSEQWTIRNEAVTCKKCIKKISALEKTKRRRVKELLDKSIQTVKALVCCLDGFSNQYKANKALRALLEMVPPPESSPTIHDSSYVDDDGVSHLVNDD